MPFCIYGTVERILARIMEKKKINLNNVVGERKKSLHMVIRYLFSFFFFIFHMKSPLPARGEKNMWLENEKLE